MLRWSNPTGGEVHGAVVLWSAGGCPVAAASAYRFFDREQVNVELVSLAEVPLTAERNRRVRRTPQAGVEFRPVPGAPEAAGTPAARRRQARQLARRFSGTITERPKKTAALLEIGSGKAPPGLADALTSLGKGRYDAADVAPIAYVRDGVMDAAEEAAGIRAAEDRPAALEEMRVAPDGIKPAGKYAEAEMRRDFGGVRDQTLESLRRLYPHTSPDLSPSRLHLNRGRDMSVETYLSGGGFEAPGQHVANAGPLRAMALAFSFALLGRHPGGPRSS